MSLTSRSFPPPLVPTAVLVVAALALTSCAATDAGDAATTGTTTGVSTTSSVPATSNRREVAAFAPRVVLTYDGGLLTIDGTSGKVLDDTAREGFLRLNDAGDGRHVFVSDGDVFRVFDTGLVSRAHGDHAHRYEQTPALTDIALDAPHAGHVVTHGGMTALFADGTGEAQLFPTDSLGDDHTPADVERRRTTAAHHGVAVPLTDGGLLITQGTEEKRDTVQVLGPDGKVRAQTTDCPGVHGEAAARPTAKGDVVTLGCENGPVVYRDGAFHKVQVAEPYRRSGNQAGHPSSPIVLTDDKTDPDAEIERTTRIGLLDTRDATFDVVDLGSPYWFRSLARGPAGEAVVLTGDGALHVLDEETGERQHRIPVVQPWQEKSDWQEPGPAVKVAGHRAYVTDAAAKKLHVVDLDRGAVERSVDLPHTPNEMAVVTGEPVASSGH